MDSRKCGRAHLDTITEFVNFGALRSFMVLNPNVFAYISSQGTYNKDSKLSKVSQGHSYDPLSDTHVTERIV